MTSRIRGTAWLLLLWTVVLLIFALTASVESGCGGLSPEGLAECRAVGDLVPVVIAVVFTIAWLIGALILLSTRPGGTARGFLIHVLVNTIAVMATLALLSLLRLPAVGADGEPTSIPLLVIPDDVLQVGLLFALVHAAVRPFLLAIAGRLVMRSLGLAVVVINALLFLLVGEIAGRLCSTWQTPDPGLLWILIDSLVFTVVLALLAAFLGIDRPRLEPESDGAVWRLIDRLPAQRRNAIIENIRLQEVYDTLSRFGMEIAVGGTALAPVRRLGDRMMGRTTDEVARMSTPAKVRLMLQQLGPTYVKLGQMASSRADALPEGWSTELDKL